MAKKEQITRAVRRKRIEAYYEFMKKVKPEKIDLSTITDNFEDGGPTCGSIGCVMGWAPAVPALAKAGLYWDFTDSNYRPEVCMKGGHKEASAAVGTVLGLHRDDRDWVFDSDSALDVILVSRYKSKGTDKQMAVNRLRFLLELDDMGVLPMPDDPHAFFDPALGDMSQRWGDAKYKGQIMAYDPY